MSRRSRYLALGLLLVLGLLYSPVLAADEANSDSEPTSVVGDVLRMLDGGVSSPAIVEWLQRKHDPIAPLNPDEMISLSKAGASDAVLQQLALMSEPGGIVAPTPVPASPQAPPTPAMPQATSNDGQAGVLFTLKYKRPADTGEENDKRWTLFVYVDGEPVTYSRSQSSFVEQTIETFKWLSPGPHVLHLLHESHIKKGKKGVMHESQVCPDPIFFEVEPGDGWRLELTYLQKTFTKGGSGPVTWALKKGGEPQDGRKNTSEDIDKWPPLCDDMEANIPEGKKTPGWIKQKLKGCVTWSSLSEGVDPWPERAKVIAALEEYDFKPPRD